MKWRIQLERKTPSICSALRVNQLINVYSKYFHLFDQNKQKIQSKEKVACHITMSLKEMSIERECRNLKPDCLVVRIVVMLTLNRLAEWDFSRDEGELVVDD